MCGICGLRYFDGRPVDDLVIGRMSDAQQHRGPDESGVYAGKSVGLGHRRLSIIDLSTGGQPLCNEDGSVWISFNGEIYNFLDLRDGLKDAHSFRTRSDTETIVHLYEQYPDNFIGKLRGMFAFALWDQSKEMLILARDRVGKKPLYYYLDDEKLVFASEIKSILCHPDLGLDIDEEAISDYLSLGYIPAPKTIYRRIRKVRPAHSLIVEGRTIREVPYWDLKFIEDGELSEDQWREMFIAEFRTAVEIRLMSEVPLGAFLSGGLDSSAVAFMMSQILKQPVKTATIGFSEDKFDESSYARTMARYLNSDHHERIVTPERIDAIEKLVWHYDEPFSDSSALPTYFVSQIAREKVTVCLSGDGGDENLAGYRRYQMDRQENRLRAFLPLKARRLIFGPLGRIYPKMDWAPQFVRAKTTFQSLARDPLEGYFESMSTFRSYEKSFIFSDDMRAHLGGYRTIEVFRDHYNNANTEDLLSRIQYLDVKTYLTDDILTKVDRASMANSLEVRCPLLDHRLMELVARMPSRLKLHRGSGKYLFKKAMHGLLPDSIINRSKMGFAIPLAEWFRSGIHDYAQEYLIGRTDPFLSSSFIHKMWKQHQSGVRDRSNELWNVLMFRLWLQRFGPGKR